MGLIKTAIISGVGLYAVKQVANTAKYRQEHPHPQQAAPVRDAQYDREYSRERPQDRLSHEYREDYNYRRDDPRQTPYSQQPLYLTNDDKYAWIPAPAGFDDRREHTPQYAQTYSQQYAPQYTQQPSQQYAPQYPQQYSEQLPPRPMSTGRQPMGFVEPEEQQDYSERSQRSSSHGMPALAEQAMSMYAAKAAMGRGGKKGNKDDAMAKGQQLLTSFMK